MKRLAKIILAVMVCSVLVFSFVACNGEITPPSKDPNNNGGNTAVVNKPTSKEVYAMSALSSVTCLSEMGGGQLAKTLATADGEVATTRPAELGEDVIQIKKYLQMFEGILLNNGTNEVVTTPTVDDGEYATYQFKMVISLPTVGGENVVYTMYYNEKASAENAPEENEKLPLAQEEANGNAPIKDEGDDDEEDELETVATKLNGVMIVGNEIFDVTGEKEIETEEGETEAEITFTTKSRENPNNYIVVKQEIEADEIEYAYSIYENGKLVSKTQVERESEDGEEEFSIQFVNIVDNTKTKTKYNIEKKVGEDNAFEIKYTVDKTKHKIGVTVVDDVYTFTYENGFSEIV